MNKIDWLIRPQADSVVARLLGNIYKPIHQFVLKPRLNVCQTGSQKMFIQHRTIGQ